MARPSKPLIDPDEVVTKALEHIDADGLERFSVRKLATDLGVDPSSLYHHFADKEAILGAVRMKVLADAHFPDVPVGVLPWQEFLRQTISAYRRALLRHPNAVPLMNPSVKPTFASLRELGVAELLRGGVPDEYVCAIIDSAETLAYGSALLDQRGDPPARRLAADLAGSLPNLRRAVKAMPRSSDELFAMQLDALIAGWTALIG